jgi:hypothetical protein
MNVMKEIETSESTPEQLLKILAAQLAAQRAQRAQSGRNRATILVSGILFIVVAASAALLLLDRMLVDLRQSDRLPMTTGDGRMRNN